ncbi:male sterility protein-domain-containing protein [Xylariaceae sp. FL1651]|nr:male sterility protein-domain-containing protein [Xylariaceae sp. FL1651]
MAKISPVAAVLGEPHFGLSTHLYECLCTSVTTIIHGAWAVNFNMTLSSFEKPFISSVTRLLEFAMHSACSPKPTFCLLSSVASVLRVKDRPIKEVLYDWEGTSDMGYGQSKWVAERICNMASQHAEICGICFPVRIIRAGQVAGDTHYGVWNPKEAIPMIVQSAITTGALPITNGLRDTHFWLPVDLAVASIVEIALCTPACTPEGSASVFHVANPTPVRWSSEFLPALQRHGLHFEAVPAGDWLRRVESLGVDTEDNPTRHLLEWLKRRYEPKVGSEAQEDKLEMDMTISRQYSKTLGNGMDISDKLVGKFLRYWEQLGGWKKM